MLLWNHITSIADCNHFLLVPMIKIGYTRNTSLVDTSIIPLLITSQQIFSKASLSHLSMIFRRTNIPVSIIAGMRSLFPLPAFICHTVGVKVDELACIMERENWFACQISCNYLSYKSLVRLRVGYWWMLCVKGTTIHFFDWMHFPTNVQMAYQFSL